MSPENPARLDRRTAIKWMLAAAAATSLPTVSLPQVAPANAGAPPPSPKAGGYGRDPDLMRDYKPGDLWPLTFSEEQRRIAAALCALIIPADDKSSSAADLGVRHPS
ncbi:MAG: hypothetical protein ACREIA_26650 [Opitutaceae bacterium]